MKLRSGFQTTPVERLYCSPQALLNQIYLLDDMKELHYHDWFLSKVQQTRGNLNYIEEYSREKLLSMDVKWLRIVYFRTVEIMRKIISASYTQISFSSKTKQEFIRMLYAANQLQKKIAYILWELRTTEGVFKILITETDDADWLYRCLRHIISDECMAHDYHIESYNIGDYTDAELWDYWFAPNALKLETNDPFLKQVNISLQGPIRFWNIHMITS